MQPDPGFAGNTLEKIAGSYDALELLRAGEAGPQ